MNTGYEGILQFRGKWRDYQERVLLHAQQYLKDGKIHRNIIYSIDATLAGRGYDDPTVPPTDFVELFVKTKVLDWGSANQSSVVE